MKSGSLQRLKRAKQSDLLVVSLGAESWCEHAAKAGPSTVNVTNITNNFNFAEPPAPKKLKQMQLAFSK